VIKPITIVFAIMISFAVWLVAGKKDTQTGVQLQTTFDFNRYPACSPLIKSNCIIAIQFHNAISNRVVATAGTNSGMTGHQVIVATAHANSFPRHVYAATVFLDNFGRRQQGPPGQTSEYKEWGAN
jgi:hypothetical protein